MSIQTLSTDVLQSRRAETSNRSWQDRKRKAHDASPRLRGGCSYHGGPRKRGR